MFIIAAQAVLYPDNKHKPLVLLLGSGSVSHENICYVYGRGDDWEDKIKQQGLWEDIPDVLEEQIRI